MSSRAVDRELAPEVQSQAKRRTLARVGLPLLLLAVLIIWLPGWIRPSLSRARIRTALVTAGPVEAVIMASGHGDPRSRARALEPARRPRAPPPPAARRPSQTRRPVVELDVSESVLALDKVVKDLKIKENQQAQTRLALEKSLVDLDGRLEVKTLRAPVRAVAARRGPAAVQGRALLARVAAPLRAGGQAGADRAGAAA